MADRSKALAWYRVVVSAAGMKASAVDAAGTEEGGVFYVRATSEEDALRLARNSHERIRMQRKRAEWRKVGKCIRCGRDRDAEGRVTCSFCLKRQSGENDRRHRRERGEDVPVPDRAEGLERRRKAERAALELELLEKLDDIWAKRGTIGARQWLRKELARRRVRSVA